MGKNLDTDNIFGSYLNNVLLKEQAMIVSGEELENKKRQLQTETDPIKKERLQNDIKASEDQEKKYKENPNLRRRDGESLKDYRTRQGIMKNYKDYYATDGKEPDWNRELTPDEAKKMKEKGWTKEQTIGMGEREKTVLNAQDTLKKQGKGEGNVDGVNYKISPGGNGTTNISSTRKTEPEYKTKSNQPQAMPVPQPDTKAQPATNTPSRGKLTVKSLQNMDELNNATDEEFIQLIKSLQTK